MTHNQPSRPTRSRPRKPGQPPPPTWTWPAALVVSVLVPVTVVFTFLLITSGVEATLACVLALAVVTGVVVCVVPACPASAAARRWGRAAATLLGAEETK
ncbi:hypothetical protein ABZV91_13045 [Nocardia sp. NPDC004568]|uniref:hypothetical protein n=1 Tax=Nocardia sp. NPDC004568 TaxID=3154551 RepID=UPI0033A70779